MADLHRIATEEEIGPLLRQIRRKQDVSAADVAEAINVHLTQVAAWERGAVMKLQSLLLMAYALGYDLALVRRERAL